MAAQTSRLLRRFQVIDVDSHVTEPPDVWTGRVSERWGERVPHVVSDEGGHDLWVSGRERIGKPGSTALAGFNGSLPDSPAGFDEIPAAAHDAAARLRFLDETGIHAQVLYPNLGGFGAATWLRLGDMDLVAECVRAYNDFLVEWVSIAPDRLLPICTTPFWDVPLAVAEIHRCLGRGHRGINFCNDLDAYGMPPLTSSHWDPIWAAAQEAGVPVSFHIGGGDLVSVGTDGRQVGWRANYALESSLTFLGNVRCIADLIFGGVCHRFPRLKFVSVESGVGWLPAILETFDWQWANGEVYAEHPEYDLLPSEYFARQIYGCFWFERSSARFAIEELSNNILFETDYPHPTCQHPGPHTSAQWPADYVESVFGDLPEVVLRRILRTNAAELYCIEQVGLAPAGQRSDEQ